MASLLTRNDILVFSTRDYARTTGVSISAATHQLDRLARKGLVLRLTRGLWVKEHHPHFTPLACVPNLLGSEQGYISFLSALHRHHLVSQIPTRIQVATTGHGRILRTPIGTYEFFQLHPRMMRGGVEWSETPTSYRMAGPEKALLDSLYLATRRGRRFTALPELDAAARRSLRSRFFGELLHAQVPATRIREAIRKRKPI